MIRRTPHVVVDKASCNLFSTFSSVPSAILTILLSNALILLTHYDDPLDILTTIFYFLIIIVIFLLIMMINLLLSGIEVWLGGLFWSLSSRRHWQ